MRRALFLAAALLAAPAPAHAAGGPVPPAFGGAGVSAPGGTDNFIAIAAGSHRTVITRVRQADGVIERSRVLNGVYGIPGVTFDGINTGLSADGGTLVLANPINAYPQKRTRFQVLDAPTLKSRSTIALPGMVTLDAISPDGRWLYFVDYRNGNIAEYDVRAYDLQRHRLLARPVVDPREPEEKLQGFPITRVQSEDGRWAYTLYSAEHPFIHALDTEGRTAVCIDMPQSVATDAEIKMTLDGDRLTVGGNGRALALVDLKSYEVSAPPPPKPAAVTIKATATATATPRPAAETDSGPPWALWLLPLAGLGALAVFARQRRARHAAAGQAG